MRGLPPVALLQALLACPCVAAGSGATAAETASHVGPVNGSAIAEGQAGGGVTQAVDASVDNSQAINAFNAKLDSLLNEGEGLYYAFETAESNRVWSTEVEGRALTYATETTPFPLASASKLYTAFAVMRTMELKPQDFYPTKYVNEFKFKGWERFANFPVHGTSERANLTVHHLLTHTSGIPFAMRDSLEDVQEQTLFFRPGTAFGYTVGHRVLGWLLRDFWQQQPEAKDVGIMTVQDTFKWLIFDELGLSCSTRFSMAMNHLFGFEGEAGDASIQSTGHDLMKLAVVALRKGRLPSGKVMISESNWEKWAIPNLLPGGKLSKDLVDWQGAAASWANWNVGGLKAKIMQQSGDFGWNYFGATYYGSKEIGWCGFFSSCLRVTYQHDLAFVMMQRSVADAEKSKPYLVAHFASMAESLQCRIKTRCNSVGAESSSIFCERCADTCQDGTWDSSCPARTERGKAILADTYWMRSAHTCYVPRCTSAPADASKCAADTGGTCRVLSCDASRGPTTCKRGTTCVCQEGFCAQEGKCVRRSELSSCCRDTGGTCSLLGCDASRGAVTCVREGFMSMSGRCICREGLCAEAGRCIPPGPLLLARNVSRAEGSWAATSDHRGTIGHEAVFAVLAAAASLVALGVVVLARWRGSSQKDDAYISLLG
uniref:Beta-lactamase-related domain-containing protein n=1 Tax=Alexandrium catenella TaxID=2925 RepID=A0A7S1S775_ALECA